ncbi:MAG: type II toxin-antitoxin system RelE/ParE family toxin [Actinomycetaceae bacterium]|nr:type II toxin-antitoxin system RelE/ParE family toxin [Actinomycetaceae bacterium]MDY5854132.1 type II toxin-antitoxin system RelE/ParE family toxin [Arcanobacterium sp.]
MAWQIKIDKGVQRALAKLDRQVAKRITLKLGEISRLDDLRAQGKALSGNLAGLWRYRVGDYRIVCLIEDETLIVLVLDVAHRKEIYKRIRT